MANKKTEVVIEKTIGTFLGITPPEFDLFKVSLEESVNIVKKKSNGEEEARYNNYNLIIDRSAITKNFHNEIADELKTLFNMSWVAFNWTSQTFNYYTSKYTGNDEFKKQQLLNIFDYLKDFEIKYKETKQNSVKEFIVDKKDFIPYQDEEFIVKYNKEIDAFVVLALSFLETDKYRMLAASSVEKGKLETSQLKESFFDEFNIKNKDNKMYFIINAYDYNNVKQMIEVKKEEKNNFALRQEEFVKNHKSEFIDFNEKNIFNFKILFNDEKKCFEFYCKGYNEPQADKFGKSPPRGILSRWALNFILSENLEENELESKLSVTHSNPFEIDLENHYKILLDLKKESSAREKMLWVPADNWDRLNKIYNKFTEVNKFFSREEKSIKILNLEDVIFKGSSGVNLQSYPAIYINEKGKSFFIYQYRNVVRKIAYNDDGTIKKDTPGYTTLKGIPITFEETENLLNNHPLSQQIKNNTVFLNAEIWMNANANQNILLNQEEIKIAFDNIYMHAKLLNQSKTTTKSKRLKV